MSLALSILLLLAGVSLGLTLALVYRLSINLRQYKEHGEKVHFDLYYSEKDADVDLLLLKWATIGWLVTFVWGIGLSIF